MSKKILLCTIEITIILLSLYVFFTPLILGSSRGHFLEDGVVVARTMFLIFMLSSIVKLSRFLLLDREGSDK